MKSSIARLALSLVASAVSYAAQAKISIDHSSTLTATAGSNELVAQHSTSLRADRMLVVGIALEAKKAAQAQASQVTYHGAILQELPQARTSAGGSEVLKTQLYYLSERALPPQAGNYSVKVRFSGEIIAARVAIISFSGVAQSAAPAALTATDSSGRDSITLNLLRLTANSVVLDMVASGSCGPFKALGTRQELRSQGCAASMSSAVSTLEISGANPGVSTSLKWEHSAANRLVLSAITLKPSLIASPVPPPVAPAPAQPVPVVPPVPVVVVPPPVIVVPDGSESALSPVGFASVAGATTGGAAGATVNATTLAQLTSYLAASEPYIIHVSGVISGKAALNVNSNKTIIGLGTNATLSGIGLKMGSASQFGKINNVIIRNLRFEKVLAPTDAVAISYGAHHIWVDHCDFSSDLTHGKDFYDGLLDITHAGDFITVSWNRFANHYKVSLIGHSDSNGAEDTGHLRITFHHNHFLNTNSRNPSIRFGKVHIFNNYYEKAGLYGVAVRENAEASIENNYFDGVGTPIAADTSLSAVAGKVSGVATNIYRNSGANSISTQPSTWKAPYSYRLDSAADVPAIVSRGAGPR